MKENKNILKQIIELCNDKSELSEEEFKEFNYLYKELNSQNNIKKLNRMLNESSGLSNINSDYENNEFYCYIYFYDENNRRLDDFLNAKKMVYETKRNSSSNIYKFYNINIYLPLENKDIKENLYTKFKIIHYILNLISFNFVKIPDLIKLINKYEKNYRLVYKTDTNDNINIFVKER